MIQRYRKKISGPLLDRINIHIEVPAVKYKEMAGEATGEPSEKIRLRVEDARAIQRRRFAGRPACNTAIAAGRDSVACNARMTPKDIKKHCELDEESQELLAPFLCIKGWGQCAITEGFFFTTFRCLSTSDS
jgi:magnesium chelatase family protein